MDGLLHHKAGHAVREAARSDRFFDQLALRVLDHEPGCVAVAQLEQGPNLVRRHCRLESELGYKGAGHGHHDAVGVEGLPVRFDGHAGRPPAHDAHRTVEPHVHLLRHRPWQRVVAALDLAVGLAPRQLDVELLGVRDAKRGRRGRLCDRGQQQLGRFGDMSPPQPLGNGFVVAGTAALDRLAQLVDDLGGRGPIEPLTAEYEAGDVSAKTELLAELDAVLGAEVGDVLLSVVDDLRPDVGELTTGKTFP